MTAQRFIAGTSHTAEQRRGIILPCGGVWCLFSIPAFSIPALASFLTHVAFNPFASLAGDRSDIYPDLRDARRQFTAAPSDESLGYSQVPLPGKEMDSP